MTIAIGTVAAAAAGQTAGATWSRPEDDASLTLRDGASEKIARCECADW